MHFIDTWEGQSVYLKLPRDDTYLWIDSYNSNKQTQLEDDLCGSPEFGEGRFATDVDVLISKQHLDENRNLLVEFGTTLPVGTDPKHVSYGLSRFKVSIK